MRIAPARRPKCSRSAIRAAAADPRPTKLAARAVLPVIIGIIGAGQLGRMLALAAYPLGLECLFYDRAADAPGGQIGPLVTGEFDDRERLGEFAARVDVITFDWETIRVESVGALAKLAPVRPPALALERSQDRLLEKCLFRDL